MWVVLLWSHAQIFGDLDYLDLEIAISLGRLVGSGDFMLSIRLARNGTKKKPFYQIVVSENAQIPTSQSIEVLGYVNPKNDSTGGTKIDAERAKIWIAKGAKPSESIAELFKRHSII